MTGLGAAFCLAPAAKQKSVNKNLNVRPSLVVTLVTRLSVVIFYHKDAFLTCALQNTIFVVVLKPKIASLPDEAKV